MTRHSAVASALTQTDFQMMVEIERIEGADVIGERPVK